MFATLVSRIGWMSQLENNKSSEPSANVDVLTAAVEEETDEFEVIHGENDDDQEVHESDLDGKVLYVERSAAVSECGPEVADVGDGLDAGNSSSSVRSHNLFDSVYSFQPPFADNSNIEKLLRDGQERHQLILQQLVSMVSDLSKEKSENSELREKFAVEQRENAELREKYERLLSMHGKAKVLTQKINENFLETTGSLNTAQKKIKELEGEKARANEQYQEDVQRLEVDNRKIVAENAQLAEQNRQLNERLNSLTAEGAAAALNSLTAEGATCRDELVEGDGVSEARRLVDDANVHNLHLMKQNRIPSRPVAQLSFANQQKESRTAAESAKANQQLATYETELANHREIVKVLQEENAELLRAMEQSRQKYRRNIDSLEEQVASYRDRGEVNFA